MKIQPLTAILGVSAITLASTVLASSPSRAEGTTFVCGKSQGVPATIAQTPQGNVPVIRWASDYFKESGYNQQTRCEIVSKRFQTYYNKRALNYLTTGVINGENVVCAARSQGGDCARDLPDKGLLFTLKPGTNPSQTLRNLLKVRVQARGPLNESDSRVYIDMKEFLGTTPVEATASSSAGSRPASVKPAGQSDGSVW